MWCGLRGLEICAQDTYHDVVDAGMGEVLFNTSLNFGHPLIISTNTFNPDPWNEKYVLMER
jgi:hypothetical protein